MQVCRLKSGACLNIEINWPVRVSAASWGIRKLRGFRSTDDGQPAREHVTGHTGPPAQHNIPAATAFTAKNSSEKETGGHKETGEEAGDGAVEKVAGAGRGKQGYEKGKKEEKRPGTARKNGKSGRRKA